MSSGKHHSTVKIESRTNHSPSHYGGAWHRWRKILLRGFWEISLTRTYGELTRGLRTYHPRLYYTTHHLYTAVMIEKEGENIPPH
jgi:hypothetical protein